MKRTFTFLLLSVLMASGQAPAQDDSVAKKAGNGVKKGAEAVGRGVEEGLNAASKGIRKGADSTGKALEQAGQWIQKKAN